MTNYRFHLIPLLKRLTSSTPLNVFVLFYLIEKTLRLGNYDIPSKYDWINNLQYFVSHYFLNVENEEILFALTLLAFMTANKAFKIKVNSCQSLKQLFLIGIFTSLQFGIYLQVISNNFPSLSLELDYIMTLIAFFWHFLAFYIIGNCIRGAIRLCFTSRSAITFLASSFGYSQAIKKSL